jgi:hypothetical protein
LTILLESTVGEVWSIVEWRVRSEDPASGEEEVEDDSCVKTPVAGVIEDEDCGDLETVGGIVGSDRARKGASKSFVVRNERLAEGPYLGMSCDNITGCDDVIKPVSFYTPIDSVIR